MTFLRRSTPENFPLTSTLFLLAGLLLPARLVAQPIDPSLFAEMHWRLIGPFRGGRARAETTGYRSDIGTTFYAQQLAFLSQP